MMLIPALAGGLVGVASRVWGMHLGGLVLEVYDSPKTLREMFPRLEDLPESVKTAHALGAEELARLPDGVFALVLRSGESVLRKYACIDRGNTELHVAFFLKHAHKLPKEAQALGAKNLLQACRWYGVSPRPELEKQALGLVGAANLALAGPSIVRGSGSKIRENLGAVRALEGPPGQIGGQVVVPPSLLKAAEPDLLSGSLDLTGWVDVAESEPVRAPIDEGVRLEALSRGGPPLETYQEVKEAAASFEASFQNLSPRGRRELAVKLARRAGELGIELGERALKYGSGTYAPLGELCAALELRAPHVGELHQEMLQALFDKRAEVQPEVYAEVLGSIDQEAMIDWMYDREITDPYASTFGARKLAEDDVFIDGNDYATKAQIEAFARTGFSSVQASYGRGLAEEFRKDPWGIFSSLPRAEKRRLVHMATDTSPTGMNHVG
jgi:HPt (histidine-containing phosphotransfer) domain-containing protein